MLERTRFGGVSVGCLCLNRNITSCLEYPLNASIATPIVGCSNVNGTKSPFCNYDQSVQTGQSKVERYPEEDKGFEARWVS